MFTILAIISLVLIVVFAVIIARSCFYDDNEYDDYQNDQTK